MSICVPMLQCCCVSDLEDIISNNLLCHYDSPQVTGGRARHNDLVTLVLLISNVYIVHVTFWCFQACSFLENF